jgi:hypothetical protein
MKPVEAGFVFEYEALCAQVEEFDAWARDELNALDDLLGSGPGK